MQTKPFWNNFPAKEETWNYSTHPLSRNHTLQLTSTQDMVNNIRPKCQIYPKLCQPQKNTKDIHFYQYQKREEIIKSSKESNHNTTPRNLVILSVTLHPSNCPERDPPNQKLNNFTTSLMSNDRACHSYELAGLIPEGSITPQNKQSIPSTDWLLIHAVSRLSGLINAWCQLAYSNTNSTDC